MTAGNFPDAWEEVALITVLQAGGTARQFAGIVVDTNIDEPDYPGESIPNTAGGRIWNQMPQEDGEITLELYPISTDEADNTSFEQYFHGGTIDSSQPIATNKSFTAGISKQRESYCFAILWTDDTACISALGTGMATSGKVAKRFYAKLARIVSQKSKFNPKDGLSHTVTFKFPPMNKAGTTKTFGWASTNDCSTPIAVLTYSSATDL